MASPETTVIVANYEGERLLGDCLESLRAQTTPPSEVIVVDAGSRDGSVALAQSLGARTLVVENRGVGFLYNRGVEAASTPFALLANNDVAFHERCLERLAEELAREPTRFAADPRQRDWADARDIHRRSTLASGPLLRQPLPGFVIDQNVPGDGVTATLLANGAAFLVRRDPFLKLGGFDESFFMEWEEIDLAWRAWLGGWEIVYVPDAVVRHRVGAVTTRQIMPRRLASSHHNLMRFALKCLPTRAAATVIFGELVRLPAHPALIGRGLGQLLVELPHVLRLRRQLRSSRPLLEWMLGGQRGPAPTVPWGDDPHAG